MKNILYYVAAVAMVAFVASSCKHENNVDEPEDGRFTLEVNDIRYNHADFSVTAEDTTITYVVMAMPAAEIDKFESKQEVLDSLKLYVDNAIAYMNGLPWTEADEYTYADYLSKGNISFRVTALRENLRYYELLFEMDATGKMGTQLYKKAFETPAFAATSNLKITVVYDAPLLTFTPSNNTEKYFCSMVNEKDLAAYGFTSVTEMAEDDIVYYGSNMDQSAAAGAMTIDLSQYEAAGYIEDGDVMYAYACGYKDGCRTTEVFSTKFTYNASEAAPMALSARRDMKTIMRPTIKHSAIPLVRK